VPGTIGHSILRPENLFLTESQSSLGVPRPRAFTPSLLLLVLEVESVETPLSWERLECPISTSSPLEKTPLSSPKTVD